MKKKIFIGMCVIMMVVGMLCMASKKQEGFQMASGEKMITMSGESYDAAVDTTEECVEDIEDVETEHSVTDISGNKEKMIISWDICIETANYEDCISKIEKMVEEWNGYVEYQNEYGQTKEERRASFTLRIPEKDGNRCVDQLVKLGTVLSKSKNTENVTLQYVDTESRLRALKTERETFEALMKKATKMEDIIQIQSQLQEVNYQIESYETQLRRLKNTVDYTTIRTEISEVTRESIQGNSIADEIKETFIHATEGLATFFRFLVVKAVGYSIYLILFAVLGIVGYKIYKKKKGKKTDVQ